MVRHPKGAQVRAFFSAHEREKFDLGTQRLRLTEDSQRQFDQCQLCLNPLIDPIATPSGYLFCRGCLVPNLLRQKQKNEELMEQYKQQETDRLQSLQYEEQRKKDALIAAFEAQERGRIVSSSGVASSSSSDNRTVELLKKEVEHIKTLRETKIDPRDKETKYQEIKDTAYWISSFTPSAEAKFVPKPSINLLDPVTNIPLKLKDLLKVNLYRIRPLGSDEIDYNTDDDDDDDDEGTTEEKKKEMETTSSTSTEKKNNDESGSSNTNGNVLVASSSTSVYSDRTSTATGTTTSSTAPRYGCPACLKGIVYQRTFLLKPCGHVYCDKCVIQFIAPNKACGTCDKTITKQDVLPLQMGGSSFAAHAGTQTIATKYNLTE